MKRYSGALLLGIFAIVFSACSTFSKSREQNLYQVHLGQSQTELSTAIGEPAKKITMNGDGEKWFYDIYSADNRETYPYTATFENGNLKKWEFDTGRNTTAEKHLLFREPASTHSPFQY